MRSPPSGVHSRSNTRRSAVVSSIISYSSSWGNYSIVREGIRCHTDVAGFVCFEKYFRGGGKEGGVPGGGGKWGKEVIESWVRWERDGGAGGVTPRWSPSPSPSPNPSPSSNFGRCHWPQTFSVPREMPRRRSPAHGRRNADRVTPACGPTAQTAYSPNHR